MHIQITDFGTAKQLSSDSKQGITTLWISTYCVENIKPIDDIKVACFCELCDTCFTARANSFVGTAQYVSPELLTEKSACKR